jgi:hypothetical protein
VKEGVSLSTKTSLEALHPLGASHLKETSMINRYISLAAAGLVLAFAAADATAVICAAGVYRAGCVGPNGAAVVRHPVAAPVYVRPVGTVHCAAGVYRAGCVGPHGGTAVIRR